MAKRDRPLKAFIDASLRGDGSLSRRAEEHGVTAVEYLEAGVEIFVAPASLLRSAESSEAKPRPCRASSSSRRTKRLVGMTTAQPQHTTADVSKLPPTPGWRASLLTSHWLLSVLHGSSESDEAQRS